jgi:hypothetical protein
MDTGNKVDLPVVFMCGGCRTVVTDSTFLLETDAKQQRIIFSGALNYEFGQKETPPNGNGETLCVLRCNHCKKEIGKWFHSTPRQMDRLRDRFCLSSNALVSYQIGNDKVSVAPVDTKHTVKQLSEDIVKMKQMLLLFYERVGALEAQHSNN